MCLWLERLYRLVCSPYLMTSILIRISSDTKGNDSIIVFISRKHFIIDTVPQIIIEIKLFSLSSQSCIKFPSVLCLTCIILLQLKLDIIVSIQIVLLLFNQPLFFLFYVISDKSVHQPFKNNLVPDYSLCIILEGMLVFKLLFLIMSFFNCNCP